MKPPLFFLGNHLINLSLAAAVDISDAEVVVHFPSGTCETFKDVPRADWEKMAIAAITHRGYVLLGPNILLNPAQITAIKDPAKPRSRSIEVCHLNDTLDYEFASPLEAEKAYSSFLASAVREGGIEPLSA